MKLQGVLDKIPGMLLTVNKHLSMILQSEG